MKSFAITRALIILLVWISSGAFADEIGAAAPPVLGLTEVIHKGLTGLSFEGRSSPRFSTKLRQQALGFIRFKKNQTDYNDKLHWMAECFKSTSENVFCEHMIGRSGVKRGLLGSESPRVSTEPDLDKVSELFTKGDLDSLSAVNEATLYRSVRSFSSWDSLQIVADRAVRSGDCSHAVLLTVLGQKSEEFFPEDKFRNLAVALYTKAAECKGPEAVEKARYRLSLLHIWAGKCRQADSLLKRLIEQKDGLFVSRALFWRSQCAKAIGNKLLFSALKGRLLKESPLSYHSLLLAEAKGSAVLRALDESDPVVSFRSQLKPELNSTIRAVESLQSLRANELALDLLRSVSNRIDSAEIPVRLYLAILSNRAGDQIGQFKILSAIFRDHPMAITRVTLEMFYPLRRFEMLKTHGAKVDPYLVAALIRQESGFNERARSPAGALGLMQLMPKTARKMGRVSKRELFDAKTNIRLGVKYFFQLLNRFNGDAELALAAYNAGPEKVDEWKLRYPTSNRMLFFDLIPYKETRDYVAFIARNYFWYLKLYGKPKDKRLTKSPGRALVFTLLNST